MELTKYISTLNAEKVKKELETGSVTYFSEFFNMKKKRKLPEVNIDKTYFYYLKDKNGQPVVTVCLMMDEKTRQWARGVSICSLSETFKYGKGRNKAYGRAKRALIWKESSLLVSPGWFGWSRVCDLPFSENIKLERLHFKSEINPLLSKFEKKLIKK